MKSIPGRMNGRSLIDVLFGAVLMLSLSTMPAVPEIGVQVLASLLLVSTIYVFRDIRSLISRFGLVLLFGSSLFLIASLAGWMPAAWTRFRVTDVAFRQWFSIPALLIIATGSSLFFRRNFLFIWNNSGLIVLIIFFISRLGYAATGRLTYDTFTLYGTNNHNISIYILISILIYKSSRTIGILFLALIFLAGGSSTNSAIFMTYLISFLSGVKIMRGMRWAALFSLALLLALAPLNPRLADDYDPNAGVRAVMWSDAISAVSETHFLGVGYGTEYIRNNFNLLDREENWGLADEESERYLYISTHSSFYDMFLRLGAFGGIMYIILAVRTLRVPVYANISMVRLDTSIAILIVVGSLLNPGIVSFNISVGFACALGFIAALRFRYAEVAPTMSLRRCP